MKFSAIAALAAAVALAGTAFGVTAATAAPEPAPFVPIEGAGSTWQAPAIFQWATDLVRDGITVNYDPDGSAAGRADYIKGTLVDFDASDVPFRDGTDKLGRTAREVVPWGYSYVPAVAGGIALVYHLTVGGHEIRDLRLSARTLMEIFTGQITNWDDPAITKGDGFQLPSLRIIPVVHTEGAGPTFYFTSWLAHEFPSQWNAFCARVTRGRVKPPCGPTEFYPVSGPGWHAKGESGSASVVSYLAQTDGAIGYDEYPYALASGTPVAGLANASGHYVRPAAANVTVALKAAIVNEDPHSPNFGQEDLTAVYADKNPASYPLSYYGYLIVPRSGAKLPPVFTAAAGRTLSTFVLYALCKGQPQAAEVGDAPLPRGLISVGLAAVARIPGHVPVPPLAKC